MNRFRQECAFLESIRHPNIVQYLGITMDPESRLPVLLMELLDESLTKMLERSQNSLAYYVQVDICYDIALAVAYLHSNEIIKLLCCVHTVCVCVCVWYVCVYVCVCVCACVCVCVFY